jgi:ADP-dependent NAD(P)H-hydrate dehydratase
MTGTADATAVTVGLLKGWLLPKPGENKKARGTALVVAGSRQTPGAVLLAAEAAIRAGAGKLQVITVESVATQLAVALPEALVQGVTETDDGEIHPDTADIVLDRADGVDAVLFGPGVMRPPAVAALLEKVLPTVSGNVVLDALALAYLSEDAHRLTGLPADYVLTPNENELSLALGVDRDELDQDSHAAAGRLASLSGAVVSSGGTTTWTASPDGRLWRDDGGGPGLGVSGSGDVKSGIILGLLARGCEPTQAAVWGAHLHARAGERLASRVGRVGYLARDIPSEVPGILTELES